jgi:hypothetical protein
MDYNPFYQFGGIGHMKISPEILSENSYMKLYLTLPFGALVSDLTPLWSLFALN